MYMKAGHSRNIAILEADYVILKNRLLNRPGLTLMGLIHEIIVKTEPQPRASNGKFIIKENE